eukprot:c498_g1_i2.p1 GENE.c498_g1_i2~~c498_g1_i2.p1  ORF type:complete len:108 (+),score=23.06 c498_g1_i2:31-354(+)
MTSVFLAGCAVAGAAYAARAIVKAGRAGKPLLSAFRPSKSFYEGSFDHQMNKKEASMILDVKENASRPEVMTRYKKLMVLNHPDQGGSEYIATKINEAKDFMLKAKR